MWTKKIVLLSIIPVLFASCTTEKEQTYQIPTKATATVGSGTLARSSEYIGYVEAIESSSVGAKTGGRIMEILAQKGDRVSAWQVLARLDGSEAKESLESANNVLWGTQNVYATTSALFDAQIASTKEKIAQAEQNIALVQSSLNGTNTGLSDTKNSTEEWLKTAQKQVEQSALALETAKSQHENTKTLLAQKERDVYLNALNAIHSADVLAENILDFTDTLYGASDANRHANDAFETYFWGRDPTMRPKGETLWRKNKESYVSWKVKIDTLSNSDSDTEDGKKRILLALTESQAFFETLRDFTNLTYSCLEASISTTTFTDATIASYKTQISTFRSNIENALVSVNGNYIVGIKGSIQNIGNIANESNLQLSLLSKQIDLASKANEVAKQNYEQAKVWATGKVNEVTTKAEIAKSQLTIAQKQYDEAVAWLKALERQKDAQLSSISTQISTIRGNKDMAGITVSNATVVAPFDGVITDKTASVGQVVGSGLPIFQIAKDNQVKIKVLIGETEIKALKVGDVANISFAGGNVTLTGSIHTIQPFSDTLSKKVPVEIWMQNSSHTLLLWAYANVAFNSSPLVGKNIPYRFIEYSYGKSVVNVVRNGQSQKVEIRLDGCNENLCVFTWPISEGEIIELP